MRDLNLGVIGFLFVTIFYSESTIAADTASLNAVTSIILPSDAMAFQEGPHVELARSYCTQCHAADYVYMQPPMAKEKWVSVINKMRQVFGCEIPEKDVNDIAEYLTIQNGPK